MAHSRAALAGLAFLFLPNAAQAAFNQTTCSSGGYVYSVPVALGAKEFDLLPASPPGSSTDGKSYNNSTDSPPLQALHVNGNVDKLRPWYSYFNTELGYDKFFVYAGASFGTTYTYQGTINTGSSLVMATDEWTVNPYGPSGHGIIQWAWHADASNSNGAPPSFGQIDVQCKTTQTSTAANAYGIAPNYRHEGLLIATGDTLYYQIRQPANQPMLIILDTLASTANADFDLIVSATNTTPDYLTGTWISKVNYTGEEAVEIPAPTSLRILNIAVHSYAGSGHFVLHGNVQTARPAIKGCLANGHTATAAEQTALTSFIQEGTTRLHASSNGNAWFSSLDVYVQPGNCDSTCDLCFREPGSGNVSMGAPSPSPHGYGQVLFGYDNWSKGTTFSWLVAHEEGHSRFSLGDEYYTLAGDAAKRVCGHTVMSNGAGYMRSYCAQNHCYDGQIYNATQCGYFFSNGVACPPGFPGCAKYNCCDGTNPTSYPSNWAAMQTAGLASNGPSFSGTHADPTVYYNNSVLKSLIPVTFH